jgi:hypothetical protein
LGSATLVILNGGSAGGLGTIVNMVTKNENKVNNN